MRKAAEEMGYRPDPMLAALANYRRSRENHPISASVAWVNAWPILDAKADAGIDQHPEEIGRVGFLMLNSLINDRSRGIPDIFRQILVEGSWVDGSSLPDKKEPPSRKVVRKVRKK